MPTDSISGNIVEHLRRTAQQLPKQLAVLSANDSFESKTFESLFKDVELCALFFIKRGINKSDRTLLMVKPGYELIISCFALIYIGAIPVIIDPGMGLKSICSCIKRTQPRVLIGSKFVILLSFFLRDTCSSIKEKVTIPEKLSYFLKLRPNKKEIPGNSPSQDSDLAAIVFTSGSTGPPKGVRYLHKNFNAQIQSLKREFGIQKNEIDLTTLPIFALFNPALGITSVIPKINPRKPAHADDKLIVDAILFHHVTTAFCSPVIGRKISDYCTTHNLNLPNLRRLMLAGAPSPPDLLQSLSNIAPNATVFVPYGSTEALPVAYCDHGKIYELTESIRSGEGSCLGTAVKGAQLILVPPTNSPLPNEHEGQIELISKPNVTGEICVSGEMVTQGYDRMPGANRDARFTYMSSEFHRMGDLGYWDIQGNLRFLGRKAECVNTKNGPLETERCEQIVNKINGGNRSALIGIGNSKDQEPCLVVELATTSTNFSSTAREILNSLEQNLQEFNIIRVFNEKKLPVDSRHNAKIHRLELARKWSGKVNKNPQLGILK